MACAFEVNRNLFEQALFGIQNVAQKRTATPILANVRIDTTATGLRLFATDFDLGLTQELEAEVSDHGSAALPARMLYDIIKKSNADTVKLEVTDNHQATITAGKRSRYRLVGMAPDDFPEPTVVDSDKQLTIDKDLLKLWIKKTLFAASPDETRASLSGVFIEAYESTNLRFVATDTHRLALVEVADVVGEEIIPEEGIILPRKALLELQRIADSDGDIVLSFDAPFVQASWGNTIFVFRTVEGRFPTYRTVIPESTSRTAVVNRSGFIAAIDRVSLVVTDRFKCVTLKFEDGQLSVSANNPEMGEGEEQIDCEFDGDTLEVGFNAQYVQDALSEITTDNIELRLIDDVSPALLYGENEETYLNVVMPMRI